MELTHILVFNAALLAALISPGPALLVSIKTTLTSGRRQGIGVGLGLATMASLWTLAALLGLEAVFAVVPWAYWAVKTAGALYLIYVAVIMWRGANDPIGSHAQPARRAFRQGLMINALNPKSVLFAAAVLVVIFPSNMSAAENALIVANHFIVEAVTYTGLAFCMSHDVVRRKYLAAKAVLDRGAAIVLGALGLRLLVSR